MKLLLNHVLLLFVFLKKVFYISIRKIVPERYRSSTNFRHCMAKLHDFRVSHTANFRKITDITYATCVENQ